MYEPALITRLRRAFARRSSLPLSQAGYSLIEVLVVLSLLGLCLVVGGVLLSRGVSTLQARGAAQDWQAAAAWAQTAAVWEGAAAEAAFESGHIAVSAERARRSGELGTAAPAVAVAANVIRWRSGEGVVVRFAGGTAAPNAAGSLYFRAPGQDYRVTVRLESGLTVRTRVGAAP